MKVIKIRTKKDIYSYSRLNTFLNCPFQYKIKYIDHEHSDKQSIEAFRGTVVHSCLEKLYKEGLNLSELLNLYNETYPNPNDLPDNIFIVRKGDYKPEGEIYLSDYYNNFYISDASKTLDTEYKLEGSIANRKFVGYIDRLSALIPDGEENIKKIYINDYKTSKTIKILDNDMQAMIYSKILKDKTDISIINKWFYLRYSQCETISYEEDELNNCERKVHNIISEIENTKVFKKKKSALCKWCSFKDTCND